MAVHEKAVDRENQTAPMHLDTEDDRFSLEIYRQLYVSLDLSLDSNPIIGVTSAIAGEGRTTIALGLARTLAKDLKVLVTLVEVDLERPTLAQHFDLATSPGLAEVLRGEKMLADIRCLVAPNLCVVTAGASRGRAASLLHDLPTHVPFHGPQGLPGIVILDLPAIMNHSYAPLAAGVADAVVLVVRAGVTPTDIVREAISRLDERPRGVVFNGARSSLPSWWPPNA